MLGVCHGPRHRSMLTPHHCGSDDDEDGASWPDLDPFLAPSFAWPLPSLLVTGTHTPSLLVVTTTKTAVVTRFWQSPQRTPLLHLVVTLPSPLQGDCIFFIFFLGGGGGQQRSWTLSPSPRQCMQLTLYGVEKEDRRCNLTVTFSAPPHPDDCYIFLSF